MSSDKDLMINDKEDTEIVDFGDLLGEGVEPLKGKGAHRVVAPTKITPGIEARRKAAQLDEVKEQNQLDSISAIPQVDPHDILSFIRPGIQHGVFKNLRQGKYEIQSMLDLHRHTVEQARQALWIFINDCHAQGVRCAIVTHGKGEGRENPARLKKLCEPMVASDRSCTWLPYGAETTWRCRCYLCTYQEKLSGKTAHGRKA